MELLIGQARRRAPEPGRTPARCCRRRGREGQPGATTESWGRRAEGWRESAPAVLEVGTLAATMTRLWGPRAGRSPRSTRSRRLAAWLGAGVAGQARPGAARRGAADRGSPPVAPLPPPRAPAAVPNSGGRGAR